MDHWHVFDANCIVGPHLHLKEGGLHTPDDLLAEMDHFGITEAFVLDSLSRENHPADGNNRILKVTAQSPRLHPAWAALPPGTTDEQPAPDELVRQMRSHRVGALFLFPRQYRFTLDDWCLDALLAPLAEARVPVFINNNEIGIGGWSGDETDWSAAVALCRRWPSLPVIVSEGRIRRANRAIYRAFDACQNLRVELSAYWLHRGIEYITRRWGSERLVFGSNWPAFGHGPTLAMLTMAEVDDRDKLNIAGDNLRRLIAWCQPQHPAVTLPEPVDEHVRFGRTGQRPDSMRFWDCHGHIGGRACHYHLPDSSLDETVREMDRLGVERICVFSFTGIFSDEAFGNDVVADVVRRYPDRFVGLTMLNPHRGRDAMLRELERGAKLGLRGIKLIPWYQSYPEDGPLLDVACQWAHERKQIILDHNWGSPEHLERLTAQFPDACFINGHANFAYSDIVRRRDNLYICSCPLLAPRDCENLVQAIGVEKLLFGSDLQDLPIAWGLGPILFARLSPTEKRLILGGNLKRILGGYSLDCSRARP